MKKFTKVAIIQIVMVLLLQLFAIASAQDLSKMPAGFCYLNEAIPGIIFDLRYKTSNNFLGRPVSGYQNARCILSLPAAEALKNVQQELHQMGLGLKVFDAYRPQRAVNDFVEWAKDINDTRMKKTYYPDVEKKNLFKDGYIAAKSSHSRGSTVDLTIVGYDKKGRPVELNMGSGFDFFGEKSHPDYKDIPYQARANRLLLRSLMTNNGFTPLAEEWWHFTYKDEPFPDNYFDFPLD